MQYHQLFGKLQKPYCYICIVPRVRFLEYTIPSYLLLCIYLCTCPINVYHYS